MRLPKDGRKVGVVVHHVASMYPLEIELAEKLAAGQPVAGVTWDDVASVNAAHAAEHDGVTRNAALDLLRRNSAAAAAAIRGLSDEQLDRAAPVSLNGDAPLTCQFFVEDHALRHSFHHARHHPEGARALRIRARAARGGPGPPPPSPSAAERSAPAGGVSRSPSRRTSSSA